MAFSIFCYFLKILKSRTDDVMMTSSLGSASVDHRFVAHDRNWSRGLVPLGRGGREEQGGGALDQMVAGNAPATMAAAEHDGAHGEQEREGEGVGGGVRKHH